MVPVKHSGFPLLRRGFVVATPKKTFDQIDLAAQKVTALTSTNLQTSLPLNLKWESLLTAIASCVQSRISRTIVR